MVCQAKIKTGITGISSLTRHVNVCHSSKVDDCLRHLTGERTKKRHGKKANNNVINKQPKIDNFTRKNE